MDDILFDGRLSKYDRYILNKIIGGFEIGKDFHLYELVEEAVTYKCLLPSQNTIIMETYYAIKEYLLAHDFLIEKREMSNYFLTEKGILLKACAAIEKFEDKELKIKRRSFIHKLFFKNTHELIPGLYTA